MATNRKRSLIIAAVLVLFCSAVFSTELGRLARLNYREMQDGQLVIELKGDQRFRYRVKEFESPPHLLIQLYNTTLGLPYNDLKIERGGVSGISARELQVNGETATFISVHMQQKLDYDFDLVNNGRTFQLTTRPAAPSQQQSQAAASTDRQPSSQDRTQSGDADFEIPPVIHVPGEDSRGTTQIPYKSYSGAQSDSVEIPYRVKEYDTSPYIVGPVILQDADISQTVRLLSEAAGGANIVVESSLVSAGATVGGGGGATGGGITVTLTHITLEDALDIITTSNNWTWRKYGDYYAIMSKDTALEGVEAITAGAVYEDTASQLKFVMIKPEHRYACSIMGLMSAVVVEASCDNSRNLLFLRGLDRDINRARELLKTIDVPQDNITKRTTQITRIIRLKYIELDSNFINELREIVTNPYFGGLVITEGMAQQGGSLAVNAQTLSIDFETNSLIFVGDEHIYERFYNVIKELDIPTRVTVAKVIPLKYANVKDFDELEELTTNMLGTARSESGAPRLAFNASTNTVTYIGTQDDYERVLKIIRTLDVKEREYITEILPLKNISASDIEEAEFLGKISKLPGFGIKGEGDDEYNITDMEVDKQTNSIIISTQRQYMPNIKKLFKSLDRSIFENLEFEVFKMKYFPAKRGASILTSLMQSEGSGSSVDMPQSGSFFEEIRSNTTGEVKEGGDGFMQSNKWLVVPSTTDSSIYVIANKPEMDMMRKIIAEFDQPYDQVKLDIQLVELTRNDTANYKLGYAYQDGRVSFGGLIEADSIFNTYYPGMPTAVKDEEEGASDGFFVYNTLSKHIAGFASSLDVLVEKINGRIIANPSVMISESTTADFDFSERFPYVIVAFDQIEVRTANDGIVIEATPHFRDDYILMALDIKVSEIVGFTQRNYPIENVREIKSEIKMENEIPFIIGGLIKTQESLTRASFPIVSDLPLIGSLFRKKQRNVKEYEVVIVITPTVVKVK